MDAEKYEMSASDEIRFWAKVDRSGGENACHLWTSATDRKYGLFKLKGRNLKAHVVAWVLANGPVPAGLIIRHVVCRNKLCVNHRHTASGTYKDNADDRERDGMTARGDAVHINRSYANAAKAYATVTADILRKLSQKLELCTEN